jgi:membrane protein
MDLTEEKSGVSSFGAAGRELLHEKPLTELLPQLTKDVTLLAQQEIALAKQEAADKLDVIKAEAVGLTLGAVLLHSGVLALVAAFVLLLATFLAPWVAATLAGGALAVGGGVLLLRGKTRLAQLNLGPKLVLENVQRDVSAIKEAAK